MRDLFKSTDSGLLLVFMEPGPSVSLPEFHEWYDSEHVPLRIHRFPTFRSATRYAVTSTTLSPSSGVVAPPSMWGAFYTISANDVFAQQSYTSLRSERSKREAELFTRLAIVDRRIYRLEYDSDADDRIEVNRKRLGLGVQRESDTPRYLVTNSVEVKEEVKQEYNRWFEEEHVPMLSKVKGWRRSRRFTLIDNGVNGTQAKEGQREGVPRCLGLHGTYNLSRPDILRYELRIDNSESSERTEQSMRRRASKTPPSTNPPATPPGARKFSVRTAATSCEGRGRPASCTALGTPSLRSRPSSRTKSRRLPERRWRLV